MLKKGFKIMNVVIVIIICFCIGLSCLIIGYGYGISMGMYLSGFCLSLEEMKELKNDSVVIYKQRVPNAEKRSGKIACRDFKKVIVDLESSAIVELCDCDVWYAQEVDECE